jgi:hypothetical protein
VLKQDFLLNHFANYAQLDLSPSTHTSEIAQFFVVKTSGSKWDTDLMVKVLYFKETRN